jgi:hypothetical protein
MRRNIVLGLIIFIFLGSNCSAPLPNEDVIPTEKERTPAMFITPTIIKTSTSTIDATASEYETLFQKQAENLLTLSPYYLTIEDIDDLPLRKIGNWFDKIVVSDIIDCHNSVICTASGFQYSNGAIYITIYQAESLEQAEQLSLDLFEENLDSGLYQHEFAGEIISTEGNEWTLLDGRKTNSYYRWSKSGTAQGNYVIVVENMQQYCWCDWIDKDYCIDDIEDSAYNSMVYLNAQIEKLSDMLN